MLSNNPCASQFTNTNKSKLIANLFVNDVENDFLRHKEANVTQFMGTYFETFQKRTEPKTT